MKRRDHHRFYASKQLMHLHYIGPTLPLPPLALPLPTCGPAARAVQHSHPKTPAKPARSLLHYPPTAYFARPSADHPPLCPYWAAERAVPTSA